MNFELWKTQKILIFKNFKEKFQLEPKKWLAGLIFRRLLTTSSTRILVYFKFFLKIFQNEVSKIAKKHLFGHNSISSGPMVSKIPLLKYRFFWFWRFLKGQNRPNRPKIQFFSQPIPTQKIYFFENFKEKFQVEPKEWLATLLFRP